jgi:hypothetical protein
MQSKRINQNGPGLRKNKQTTKAKIPKRKLNLINTNSNQKRIINKNKIKHKSGNFERIPRSLNNSIFTAKR